MRRLATSDRRLVTAAECVYSTWQYNPLPGGEADGKALCGSRLASQPIYGLFAFRKRQDISAGMEAASVAAVCEETASQRRGGGRGHGQYTVVLRRRSAACGASCRSGHESVSGDHAIGEED